MSDRSQNWVITADFQKLVSSANRAAKAVRNLRDARNEANATSHKQLLQNADQETQQMDKLTEAIREQVVVRRRAKKELDNSTKAYKDSAIMVHRATSAYDHQNRSLRENTDAHTDNASAASASAAASHAHSRALNTNTRSSRANAAATANSGNNMTRFNRAIRRSTDEVRNMSGRLGLLNRVIQDTQTHSRSWGLIMKMLPLTAVTSAINSLAPAIAGLGGAFIGLLGTMGPVFGMLGAFPALLAGVGGAIGGIISGVSGIGGAFGKWRKYQEAQTKAQTKNAANEAKNAAAQAKAERSKQRSIRNTQRSLAKAQRDEIKAREQITEAEQQASETAQDNARRIRDANRTVVAAQDEVRKAQQGVNQARRDAARAIQEYRDKLRGAVMDEESAAQALEQARAAQARVALDPGSTDLERRAANLAVRQAEHQLDQVRKSNVQLEREAEDATKKGVENSDLVVAAKQAEVDAHQNLADAQEGLQDSQRNAARSAKASRDAIADAKEAYADSGERVRGLKEDLADLVTELNEVENASGSAADAATQLSEYESALAELPPAARLVVKELIALEEAWKRVAYRAQEAISPGLLAFMQDLRFKLLPPVSDFLVSMAAGAGAFAEGLGDLLTSRYGLEALNDIFEDAFDVMGLLGEATLNLTHWLLGLGQAARKSGLTRWLGDTLRRWTAGWAEATTTPEGLANTVQAFQDTMKYTEMWGRALRDTWRFLRTFFRGFRPLGEWMLESISETTKRWDEWAKSPAGEEKLRVWQELAKINLTGFANTIRTITAQGKKMFDGIDFQRVWDALNGNPGENNGLLNALGDLLGIVTEDMIVRVFNLGESLMGLLQAFGEGGGMQGVILFVDFLGGLFGWVDKLFTTVPGLTRVLGGLLALFAAKKFVVAMSAMTGLTDLTGAVTATRAKGYVRGTKGYTGAVVKEYLGWGNLNRDLTTMEGSRAAALKQPNLGYDRPRNIIALSGTPGPSSSLADAPTKAQKRAIARRRPVNTGEQGSIYATAPVPVKEVAKSNALLKTQATLVGGVRGAVKGVSSAFGGVLRILGPIGVALIAWQGISAVAKHFERIGPTVEDTAGAIDELIRSSERGLVAIDNLFLDKKNRNQGITKDIHDLDSALEFLEDRDHNWVTQLETGLEGLFGPLVGVETRSEKVDTIFAQMDSTLTNLSYEDAVTAFKQLAEGTDIASMSADELAQRFPEYMESIKRALREASTETQVFEDTNENAAKLMKGEMVNGLQMYEGELISVEEATRRAKPTTEDYTEAIRKQEDRVRKAGDAHREGVEAIKALRRAQEDGINTRLSAQEAEDRYVASIQDANKAVRDAIAEGDKNARSLDNQNESGRRNREMLRGLASDARGSASAMLENEASIEEVNAEMTKMRDEVLALLQDEFGLSADAAKAYADELGLIPDFVGTEVLLTVDTSEEKAKQIEKQIAGMPIDAQREIRIIAKTEGFDEAQNQIAAILGPDYKLAERTIFTGKTGVTARAGGGAVFGPGTSTSDSIPALLSDGEYVIKTRSARSLGYGTLEHLNRTGRLPGYKTGGRVKRFAAGGKASGGSNLSTVHSMTVQFGDLARSVQPAIRQIEALTSLGARLRTPVSQVIDMINTITGSINNLGKEANRELGTPWYMTWEKARLTALNKMGAIVTGMTPLTTSMLNSWTRFMNAQKVPITNAIKFINDTLGTAVNTIARHYGVTSTPFPVKIPGFSEGGWTGPGSKYTPAGVVHADEFVVSKDSRRNIERQAPGLLNYMNQRGSLPGYAVGGRVRPVTGPESRNYSGHSGLDYKAAVGTPVRAAADGSIISTIRKTTSYGWHIVQRLSQGLKAVYAHLSGFNVIPGQGVRAGQVIGRTGNTGNSTGPHLHFEVGTSFGRAGNRNLTRAWLGGASGILSDAGFLEPVFDAITPMKDVATAAAKMTVGMAADHGSWGNIVGKVVESLAAMPLKKLEAMTSSLSASGNFGTGSQRDNAFGIIDVAMRRGLGHRGALLGIMAAMQESSLINIRGGDRDSLGLFQQRPSMGWGTPAQIMDPVYAANKFYDGLVKLPTWQVGEEWQDIQAVQISAFPRAYQKHKPRALQYLAEWAKARNMGFARGGWTGPGSKYTPAGVVHADEFVINKDSRRRIERLSPGFLDTLNNTGNLPGYAEGGQVAAKTFPMPSRWKNFKIFLSYLREAENYDPKNPSKPRSDIMEHVRFLEELMAFEGGLIWRKDITGRWGPKHVEAWKAWQKKNEMTQTGKVDDSSVSALMAKHKLLANYESALPYVPGMVQPSRLDVLQSSIDTSNKQMTELTTYINKFRAMGLTALADKLKELGPTGIPDEFRDSTNPLNGLQLAREYNKNEAAARKYNEALRTAAQFAQQASATNAKMDEMLALLQYGEHAPYGLESIARELGVSIDTAVVIYRKLLNSGALKNLSATKTSRLRGDVADFDNLFKFNKGGIVPGVGDTDKVMALLTPGELVVPKDVVQSLFKPSSPLSGSVASYTARTSTRVSDSSSGGGDIYQFNTTVNNPIAETPSTSVQKRVRSVAALGLLGRRD